MQRRIVRIHVNESNDDYWIAAEDYPLYCAAAGKEAERGLIRTGTQGKETEGKAIDLLSSYIFTLAPTGKDSAVRLLRRHVMFRGPFTISDLKKKYSIKEILIKEAISSLATSGEIIRLKDSAAEEEVIYCHRKVYERIKQKTIVMARSDIKPKAPEVYCSFLFNRHMLNGDVLPPDEKLFEVIKCLQGQYFPVSWWEDFILPARIAKYEPKMLDYLCSTGSVQWIGKAGKSTKEAAFFLTGEEVENFTDSKTDSISDEHSTTTLEHQPDFTMDEVERKLLEILDIRGASFLKDLSKLLSIAPADLLAKLERLVWSGIVTNDSFAVARYYIDNDKKNSPWMKYNTYPSMGRWYRTTVGIPGQKEKLLPDYINELLDRYGILSKDIMEYEKGVFKWSEVYSWLKNNEFTSGIKRGFYISGLSGIQFARDRDIELIRMQDSPHSEETYITLCSCDPTNPYKDIFSKVFTAASPVKTAKHQGTAVVFRNGCPVLSVKEYGTTVLPLTDDRAVLEKAAESFIKAFHSRMLWTGRKNVFTEHWKESADESGTCKIEDSPLYEKLQELGFERGYSGITLWRKII